MGKLFTNQKEIDRAIKAAEDQAEKVRKNFRTHCVICGCMPQPDQWSRIATNCCFDCA